MDEEKKEPAKQEVTFEMLKNVVAKHIKKQIILEGRVKFLEAQLGFKFNDGEENAKIKKPTLIT